MCIFPSIGALPTTELTLYPKLTLFYPTQYIMPLLNIWPIFGAKYKNKHFHTVKNLPCKQVCNSFLTRMFVESLYDFSVYIELKEISFFFLSLYSGLDILADEVGSEPKNKSYEIRDWEERITWLATRLQAL